MSTIVTRAGKGSPLTNAEVDNNFTNLNTDKYQEGSEIGSTTPAAGTFTTLTATDTLTLNKAGVATAKVWSNTGTSPIADLELQRGVGTVWGDDGYTDYRVRASGGNFIIQSKNNSTSTLDLLTVDEANNAIKFSPVGVEQMRVTRTASAVNYVQVTGAATSSDPTISAQGSDASINFTYLTKGSAGEHRFSTNTGGNIQFKVTHTASAANYLAASGSVTGSAPTLKSTGSDTNISQVFQSKGTGAIDLAAGSSGVNISNGGTVTAITRTAAGSGYTSIPSVAISAPTTAGGVQATATVGISASASATITSGGTGYTVNDVLTISGGTSTTTSTWTVTAVSGGIVTAVTRANAGVYSVAPSNPASTTGGTGTGCTLTLSWVLNDVFTITNAGSGYVEQPTVSFSGGGGSGAAAFATVGSNATLKSLSSVLSLQTDIGEVLRITNNSGSSSGPAFLNILGGAAGGMGIYTAGANANVGTNYVTKGTAAHSFSTNGTSTNLQFNVAHTASAVNYVQVTGAATGSTPTLSVQGSDADVGMLLQAKGARGFTFQTRGGGTPRTSFIVADSGVASINYIQAQSNTTGNGPVLSALGTDTNIDLTLTPKGTGNVRFGTLTASADAAITGYITIKDSGGTVRKLAVIA